MRAKVVNNSQNFGETPYPGLDRHNSGLKGRNNRKFAGLGVCVSARASGRSGAVPMLSLKGDPNAASRVDAFAPPRCRAIMLGWSHRAGALLSALTACHRRGFVVPIEAIDDEAIVQTQQARRAGFIAPDECSPHTTGTHCDHPLVAFLSPDIFRLNDARSSMGSISSRGAGE